MALKYVQTNTLYQAGAGSIVGAVTVVLTNLTDIYGNVLTMADFGTKGYGTCESDTTNEEAFIFTSIVANANGTYSLTGVATTLGKSPYTETSGLVRQHAGGTKVVITDNVAFWNTFANKQNDEALVGRWTTSVAPVNPPDLVNKSYADGVAIAGAPDASPQTKGISKLTSTPLTSLSTATITIASPAVVTNTAHGLILGDTVQFTTTGALPTGLAISTNYYVITAGLTANTFQLALTSGGVAVNTSGSQSGVQTLFRTTPFAVGNDDLRLSPNSYATSTGSANAYILTLASVPVLVAGQAYAFKANFTNTGSATINVNGTGAKTIKKVDGATNLTSGDIASGQIVELAYDGTSFQMISPVANIPLMAQTTFYGDGSDGTVVISSNTSLTRDMYYDNLTIN
jgi:hypothetical protein